MSFSVANFAHSAVRPAGLELSLNTAGASASRIGRKISLRVFKRIRYSRKKLSRADADAGRNRGEIVNPPAADIQPAHGIALKPEGSIQINKIKTADAGGEMSR